MERDSILAHGISGFLSESMMERSDKYTASVDQKDGLLSGDDREPAQTHVQMPYSFKLLLQELQTMSIGPRLSTEDTRPTKSNHRPAAGTGEAEGTGGTGGTGGRGTEEPHHPFRRTHAQTDTQCECHTGRSRPVYRHVWERHPVRSIGA